jgi:hypothetical protein
MATAPIDPNTPQFIYRPPQSGTVDNNQNLPSSQTASTSTQQTAQSEKTQTAAAAKAASESNKIDQQENQPPLPPPPTVNTSGQLTGTTISTTA